MIVDITRWKGRNAGLVTTLSITFASQKQIQSKQQSWNFFGTENGGFQISASSFTRSNLWFLSFSIRFQLLDSPCQTGGFLERWRLWIVRTPCASCKTYETTANSYYMLMLAIATTMVIAMVMVIFSQFRMQWFLFNGNAMHMIPACKQGVPG